MFGFLSKAVDAVLGGEDDDGFFDLASAEELVQRLEHSGTDSFPFPTSEDDAEAETTPETAKPITNLLPKDVSGYLSEASIPLPKEEQAILGLKLPKDVGSPDRMLTDICKDQESIITPDDTATTSETLESSPGAQSATLEPTSVATHGYLGHVHGHMIITPPKHPTKDEIATVIDITESPVTRGLTPQLQTEASTVAVLGRAVTPKKSIINTVKSLGDIVRETTGDDELEAISFDDIHGDIWHDAAPVLDVVTAGETLAPLLQTPPQKTVRKNVSNKVVPPLSAETKSPGKKKRAPRCSKCHEQGHFKRDCPRRKKTQVEQTPVKQPVRVSLAQTLEDETVPPAPTVLSPDTPSNNTSWSIINRVWGMLGAFVCTREDRVQPATSFALFGHPELMADDSEADTASESLQHVFGPSTLTGNESAHDLSGFFGPSYLTDGYWEAEAPDETTSDHEPVPEERKIEEPLETGRDMADDPPKEPRTILLPSTLTEKQRGTHHFSVLGPGMLMTDGNQPELRDTEQEEDDKYWDTDDTLVSPAPKTDILQVIANHVPWFGSRRQVAGGNARGEAVEPRPPEVVLKPTTDPHKVSEARHPIARRPNDRPLTAVTGKKDRATKPVVEMDDISPAPAPAAAATTTKGFLPSPKILPLGMRNGPLHQSEPLQPHPTPKKLNKLPKPPKTPKKSQQPPEKGLDNPGSTAPPVQPLSQLSKRQRRKASAQRRKVKEAASLVAHSLPYKVTVAPHIEAWSYASMAYSSPGGSLTGEFGPHHLVMWTDATFPDERLNKRLQAMAVTYRQPSSSPPPPLSSFSDVQSASDETTGDGWRDFAYTADIERESSSSLIDVLETLAVELAVSLALREVVDKKTPPPPSSAEPIRKVTVFTDSQAALLCLQIPRNAPIETYAAQLKQRGVEVHLRWVPGHANLGGNERADRLALLASNYAPAPETKGGLVRVPVPLLRACERQVELMEAWCRAGDQDVLRPFMKVQRRELKEALRAAGVEEGWVGGGGGDCG
ncbi:hypothetical protein GE09DRAFT_1284378 [Coniochaeta sp. 2T2.1]|nr:hypothetical protein GE09DRAFT_1284378 [Coniochaeta sp. 2T2.1]